LNDTERFALADRIQKRVNEKHPHFRLIKRKDEIEKNQSEKRESQILDQIFDSIILQLF
jgi:hypothetical protein